MSSAKLPIARIMDTWTRQMGFPVLELRRSGASYLVSQRRFLADKQAQDDTQSPYRSAAAHNAASAEPAGVDTYTVSSESTSAQASVTL